MGLNSSVARSPCKKSESGDKMQTCSVKLCFQLSFPGKFAVISGLIFLGSASIKSEEDVKTQASTINSKYYKLYRIDLSFQEWTLFISSQFYFTNKTAGAGKNCGLNIHISYLVYYVDFHLSSFQNQNQRETFKTELFLNRNDLNSGLYEGEVTGRRRFGETQVSVTTMILDLDTTSEIVTLFTQVPHGYGAIFYFSNDKYNR